MKNKYLLYALPIIMGAGMLGIDVTSAKSFKEMWSRDPIAFQETFSEKAQILGVSDTELKDAWSQGKTILDVAKEKGITQDQLKEKMKAYRLSEAKKNLQLLVDKGVLTQTQADNRYKLMENNTNKTNKHSKGVKMEGLGMGW